MAQAWARVRSWSRALWRARHLDAEMDEEIRFHVDMEAERLIREQGLNRVEARRRAFVAFGGVEKYKEEGRDTRGVRWLDAVLLDARLGLRMLVKHRGLTLAGGFAMAVAIGIGAAAFEALSELLTPALPLPGGERVVSLQLPAEDGRIERRVLRDLVDLRQQIGSIEQIGAFRSVQRNLVAPGLAPEPIRLAEISASGFVVASTPALVGRYLLPEDEREGAPPVIVIGHDVWHSRFHGDAAVVGREINLGGLPHTIVGVMPEDFRFPYNHQFWVALTANPLAFERHTGPSLYLFGRLREGVTLVQAQAELTAIGHRFAVTHPQTQDVLMPRVLPYPREHVDLTHPTLVWVVRLVQVLVGVLACVVAVNLAILMYARTITRLPEIAVRSALGASRRRILAQLFVEGLALALVGAVVGVVFADVALGAVQALARANGGVPFWIQFELSPATVLYACGLAVLAALIMGVLPGLKATGHRTSVSLRDVNGRAGSQLGPVWTTLVVAQVTVAVAVLPVATFLAWQVVRIELSDAGFDAERFLIATVSVSDEPSERSEAEVRATQLTLLSRLRDVAGVTAVTFSSAVPGYAGSYAAEFEPGSPAAGSGRLDASTMDVDVDLFGVYGVEIRAGRALAPIDLGEAGGVAVNQTFADVYFAGRSPLGMRLRYVPDGHWREIVGVIRDFPDFPSDLSLDGEPVIYRAAPPGRVHPFVVSVRFAGTLPAGAVDRVRAIGAEVDPALQLRRVVPLAQFYQDQQAFWRSLAWGVAAVTLSVLLLSAAGIYALMSFSVAQRTREAGIRIALGAHPRRIVLSVLGRAAGQLTAGLLLGAALSGAAVSSSSLGPARAASLVGVVAVVMLVVGLLAAAGPARRSLRIQASEALRADG
jgi:putative ABC transport system permease protein